MYKKLGICWRAKMMNNVAWISWSIPFRTDNFKVVRWKGIIFMSISEAIKEHPELVRKYLGTVIPQR
jgi:Fe-S cluster assembly protein SufB